MMLVLMEQTLSQHLAQLETKIVTLRRELREDGLTTYERAERELALQNAESALNFFRKAYELEQRLPS